ncbi:oligosaccharide flippase family protein [Granulicella sp. dw_53]|uniref:lipopolysaccharide biosynthesis protein n=1 Tax=Granulicella sp. dw_53 TaxID=2719792 RepID=UPI001BD644F8|nr:oligosaccharide flippase family protein [Granulicella sp. dw_53]
MKAHLSNAAYGVLDYVAYPLGMLVAAPILLRHLGSAQYGIWIVATAMVSMGGIIASGFGDANIQYVATARGREDQKVLLGAVRSMLGINLGLGTLVGLISWLLSHSIARHVIPVESDLSAACLWALRIACLMMFVRAVESVCISTQRAFERYGTAVRISILARLLSLVVGVALTYRGFGVVSIMCATGVLMLLGTLGQLVRLAQQLSVTVLLPKIDRQSIRALWGFGAFSWLQAVSGVIFSQADRLVLGISLGATVVAAYALCVQMAQPIYGIISSGLHFMFPYLSARHATMTSVELRGVILKVFTLNLVVVLVATVAVLLLGPYFLRAWMGEVIAKSATAVLSPIVWSFSLLGLSVTGYYAMLALGRVQVVTLLNIAGGAAMLLLMGLLLPFIGIRGVAAARLIYGAITLLMYVPLFRLLRGSTVRMLAVTGIEPVCEDA